MLLFKIYWKTLCLVGTRVVNKADFRQWDRSHRASLVYIKRYCIQWGRVPIFLYVFTTLGLCNLCNNNFWGKKEPVGFTLGNAVFRFVFKCIFTIIICLFDVTLPPAVNKREIIEVPLFCF